MSKIFLNPGVRRTFLKTLASGGLFGAATTLPGVWSKPAVDSVLLPGHAETTCDELSSQTELTIPGTTINVCEDVFERPQQELYTFYTLGHVCGQLGIVSSYDSFGTLELDPDPLAVGPNQILIYRKRQRTDSSAPAQMAVFTALGASTVISMGCDESSDELIAGTLAEDEVPLDVDGHLYSAEVTIQGNADPLQLILAELVVH